MSVSNLGYLEIHKGGLLYIHKHIACQNWSYITHKLFNTLVRWRVLYICTIELPRGSSPWVQARGPGHWFRHGVHASQGSRPRVQIYLHARACQGVLLWCNPVAKEHGRGARVLQGVRMWCKGFTMSVDVVQGFYKGWGCGARVLQGAWTWCKGFTRGGDVVQGCYKGWGCGERVLQWAWTWCKSVTRGQDVVEGCYKGWGRGARVLSWGGGRNARELICILFTRAVHSQFYPY